MRTLISSPCQLRLGGWLSYLRSDHYSKGHTREGTRRNEEIYRPKVRGDRTIQSKRLSTAKHKGP